VDACIALRLRTEDLRLVLFKACGQSLAFFFEYGTLSCEEFYFLNTKYMREKGQSVEAKAKWHPTSRGDLEEGLQELGKEGEKTRQEFEKNAMGLTYDQWKAFMHRTELKWAIQELEGDAEPGHWMSDPLQKKMEKDIAKDRKDSYLYAEDYVKTGRTSGWNRLSEQWAMDEKTVELLVNGVSGFRSESEAYDIVDSHQDVERSIELVRNDAENPQKMEEEIEVHAQKLLFELLKKVERTGQTVNEPELLEEFRKRARAYRDAGKNTDFWRERLRLKEEQYKENRIARAADRIDPAFLGQLVKEINSSKLEQILKEENELDPYARNLRMEILAQGGGIQVEEDHPAMQWLIAHGAKEATLSRNQSGIEKRQEEWGVDMARRFEQDAT